MPCTQQAGTAGRTGPGTVARSGPGARWPMVKIVGRKMGNVMWFDSAVINSD